MWRALNLSGDVGYMETSGQDSIVRALRHLTIAVWALTAVLAVFVGMYLVAFLPAFAFFSSSAGKAKSSPAALSKSETRYSDISELPLGKRIEASSVILIAKYQKDGDRNKCVISEILKLVPETKFQYNIGDEFQHCSHYPKSDENRGDGQLVFFVGNPAEYRYASMIYGGSLSGFGNMPIDLLRKQISDETKSE
jgi:hypothetical protein